MLQELLSLLEKNNCQYADGGFGSLVPIREAILRGATEIDAIILETEVSQFNRLAANNPFSLLFPIFLSLIILLLIHVV